MKKEKTASSDNDQKGNGSSRKPLGVRFSRINVLGSLAVCAALGFTAAFFSPADIFIAAQADFFVSAGTMLSALALTSLFITVELWGVMLALLVIGEKPFSMMRDLTIGLVAAMYVQMIFLNGGLNLMTGNEEIFSKPSFEVYINFAVFVLIIPVMLYIRLLVQRRNSEDETERRCGKLCALAAVLILAAQLAGSAGMAMSCGISDRGGNIGYLSYDGAMELSPRENVVVFLTDRVDGSQLDSALEEYPEMYGIFEGFTYYRDNISEYSFTFPSVPSMLSGREYNGDGIDVFLSDCWSGENTVRTIKESGSSVTLILDGISTYHSLFQLSGFTDNYRELSGGYSINYTGKKGIIPTMLCFSMVKLMPYQLKSLFAQGLSSWTSDDFFKITSPPADMAPWRVKPASDKAFYNYLCSEGLRTGESGKTFSFVHLNASHEEFGFEIELCPEESTSGHPEYYVQMVRGTAAVLEEYFSQMKKLGIYDSSTIIVVADHGALQLTRKGEQLPRAVTAALLIKEAGAKREPLKTNETAQMSNAYFSPSVLEYTGLPHEGVSYRDVLEGGSLPERTLMMYNAKSSNAPAEFLCKYTITGSGLDFSDWKYSTEK